MEAKDTERQIPRRPEWPLEHFKTDAVTRSAEAHREELIQQGRREVVEFFNEQTDFKDDEPCPYYVMNKAVWESQVKKWGIK